MNIWLAVYKESGIFLGKKFNTRQEARWVKYRLKRDWGVDVIIEKAKIVRAKRKD